MLNDQGVQLRSGRIVLPIQVSEETPDAPVAFRSLCWFSDDNGTTWRRGTGRIEVAQRGAMEPAVVERRDGSLLMTMRTQLGDQYQAESGDGGDTWTAARPMGLVGSESPANLKRLPSTSDLFIVFGTQKWALARSW